jgi:hypothetical protein
LKKAYPADADPFRPGGKPQVLYCGARAVKVRIAHRVASQHSWAEALSIACDAKIQWCVENSFELEREVLFASFSMEGLGSTQPFRFDMSANLFPQLEIIDDDKVPRLREANGTCLMCGGQDPR